MRKTILCLFAWGLGLATSDCLRAGVTDIRENAFAIESTAVIKAPPAVVFRELGAVSRWWDPAHTWSGSARNLSLQLQAGGCFCEKLANGGSVQHGRVINVQPGVLLRLDAPLGPLQEMPVTAVLTFKLRAVRRRDARDDDLSGFWRADDGIGQTRAHRRKRAEYAARKTAVHADALAK
jgi:uncharacterized protein YndB with AHSA1/START domain